MRGVGARLCGCGSASSHGLSEFKVRKTNISARKGWRVVFRQEVGAGCSVFGGK